MFPNTITRVEKARRDARRAERRALRKDTCKCSQPEPHHDTTGTIEASICGVCKKVVW